MARATRIALDLALVSLRTVRPVVSNIWSATKRLLINTPVKPLVSNPLIRKAENVLDNIASTLLSKIKTLRDRQLPAEAKYLEKELEKVKRKMDQKGDSTSTSLKPALTTVWRYAKVEMIPPCSQAFFHGPPGQKMEEYVSKLTDNFISGINTKIHDIETEKLRQIKAKEAAVKAAQEKVKAVAKKKEEARLKAEAEKKAKEAKKVKEATEKAKREAAAKEGAKSDKTKAKADEKKKEIKKEESRDKNKTDSKPTK